MRRDRDRPERTSWRLVSLLAAVMLAVTACPDADEPETQPTPEPSPMQTEEAAPETVDSLQFAVTFQEQNLTPWTQSSGYPGYYMMTLIYDTLFWMNPDGEPEPWLLDDWEVSDDGLEWTLHLNEDVRWQDGEPLTSSDVRFTIEYLREHPRPRFTPPLEAVEEIETPDEHTVVLRLSEVSASFVRQALADVPIIPEHIWSEIEDPNEVTTETMIGSGPYRLAEFEPEEVWRFEANEDYFRGEPLVGELVMPFIAEPNAAFLALGSGEVDAVSATLSPELEEQFEEMDEVEIAQGPGFRGWYIIMNTERAPFDDPEFRKALTLGVDVDDIVETAALGRATAGSPGFVHRDAPWANPDTRDHEQDVERSNEILDELGYDDSDDDGVREGPDGPLSYELIVRATEPQAVRTAELVSEFASEVGVELNVTALDPETAGDRTWPDTPVGQFQGDYHIGVHSWAGVIHSDPDFLVGMFHSDPSVGTFDRTAYSNEEYDQLAEEQSRTPDEEERRELLHEMQGILAEDVPAFALFYPDDMFAYRPQVWDGWVYYSGVGILNKAAFLPR